MTAKELGRIWLVGALLPLPPLNPALVSGSESHSVNYALQYITGTTSDFSFQYRSTALAKLNND